MTHPPADILRQLLIDLTVAVTGTTADWTCFVSHEPDSPDKCITVETVDGRYLARSMVSADGLASRHYGVKILVRSQTELEGWVKADAILTALSGVYGESVTVDTSTYLVQSVVKPGNVLPLGLGPDGGQRYSHSLNAMLDVSQTT